MEFSKTDKGGADIGKFIAETLKKTVYASRSRLIIFYVILFLQFLAVPLITILSAHSYPDTFNGLTKKTSDELTLTAFIALFKYVLLLILLFKSPAERTSNRSFAKYVVLIASFYVWIVTDLMFAGFHDDENKYELAKQSFLENTVLIYGKVVFASYKRRERMPTGNNQAFLAIAENLSPQTNGYLVIVQMNDSIYSYEGLKRLYHPFNDYTIDRKQRTNIPKKVPDLSNCLQFTYDFPDSLNNIPSLPAVGKYVKIIYDPGTNWIELFTNPATAVTACFDSIPKVRNK